MWKAVESESPSLENWKTIVQVVVATGMEVPQHFVHLMCKDAALTASEAESLGQCLVELAAEIRTKNEAKVTE
jgi:hypothetical protein